jgi:exodeoxyribonuclease V gamma subunit
MKNPGLHIVQSNRLENLASRFADMIVDAPLPDPLRPERVVVHDRTMGEWLDLMLARAQGVSANVMYRSPGQLIWDLYRSAGLTTSPRSVFDVEVLQWHILRLLEDEKYIGAHAPLKSYLGGGGTERRFDLALRLAELYNRYLVYRMDWLRSWELGEKRDLGPDEPWQADLWRRLTHELREPHRATLFSAFLEGTDAGTLRGLPDRLSVFGISSLSPAYVKILQALGRRMPVYVYLLNPSREKWDDIADERYRSQVDLQYSAELMHIDVPHALLGSLGKQGRDFIRFAVDAEGEGSGVDGRFDDPGMDTLLHALQSGILRLSEEPVEFHAGDASLTIHSCHSRMREVEVLRDQMLAMLDQNPTLRASDILVLAPDIDLYAPYCEAVFGRRNDQDATRPASALPVHIAERKTGRVDIIVDLWMRLLALPLSRFDADLILDLLRLDPLSDAFGISAGDAGIIAGWVEGAGIRWGLSGEQKKQWGLPPSDQFTWEWGLRRMVLGVALPREMTGPASPLYGGLLPFDQIEGQQVELLDRFLSYLDALRLWVEELGSARTITEWDPVLSTWLDRFTGDEREYTESRDTVRDLLDHAVTAATEAGYAGMVDQGMLRLLFAGIDAGSQPGARFLGGGITFASMKPMRPLPYRVIAVLGMGDGEFPRTVKPPSFDLMQTWYRYGDRSGRLDDRYLFLELLLSARDRFLVTYIGEDIRSGKPKAMSPVLSEVLEFIGKVAFDRPGAPGYDRVAEARRSLAVVHPLQAFSRRYFDGSDPRLFSYAFDASTIAGEAGSGKETGHNIFPVPLGKPGEEFYRVRLDDLCRFFSNPASFLIRKRLGAYYREAEDGIEAVEPLTMGNIETRAVYRALYEQMPKHGLDEDAIFTLLQAGGELPVGVAAQYGFRNAMEAVRPFIDAYRSLLNEPRLPGIAAVRMFGPWSLEIDHAWVTQDGMFAVKPGNIHEKDYVSFWIRFLAVSLVHPSGAHSAIQGTLLGINAQCDFRPEKDAGKLLARLLDAYGEGLRRPLPFFPRKAMEFVTATTSEAAKPAVAGKQNARGGAARDAKKATKRGATKSPGEKLDELRMNWGSPDSFAKFDESDDPYISRSFLSGDDAITEEFRELAELIMGRIVAGMDKTDLVKKKKGK